MADPRVLCVCKLCDFARKFMGISCNKLAIIIVWVCLIASEIKDNNLITEINKNTKILRHAQSFCCPTNKHQKLISSSAGRIIDLTRKNLNMRAKSLKAAALCCKLVYFSTLPMMIISAELLRMDNKQRRAKLVSRGKEWNHLVRVYNQPLATLIHKRWVSRFNEPPIIRREVLPRCLWLSIWLVNLSSAVVTARTA